MTHAMAAKTGKSMQDLIDELRQKKEHLKQGGGADRLAKQKGQGKLTARERIEALADPGSFEEIGLFAQHRHTEFGMAGREVPADGVVTGAAAVDGRLVHLASQDFTVLGGSAGEVHSLKVADAMKRSLKTGSPFVFINDSGGARVQEGIDSLSGYGQVFYANVLLSGAVPQISLICGPCAGGASYSPALTDFVIQTRQGPDVHYRTASHQAGDRRGDFGGSARWRGCAHDALGRHSLCRRRRPGCDSLVPPLAQLPAGEQSGRRAADHDRRQRRSQPRAKPNRAGRSQAGLRRPQSDCRHRRTVATFWRSKPVTP